MLIDQPWAYNNSLNEIPEFQLKRIVKAMVSEASRFVTNGLCLATSPHCTIMARKWFSSWFYGYFLNQQYKIRFKIQFQEVYCVGKTDPTAANRFGAHMVAHLCMK